MLAHPLRPKDTSNRGGRPELISKAYHKLARTAALVAVFGTCSVSLAAVPAPAPAETAPSVTVQQDEWDDALYFLLLWIYQILGGDPNNITPLPPPVQCMDIVADYYGKNGMKPGLSPSTQAEFRAKIEALTEHLSHAPSTISSSYISLYKSILARMYSDVGGNPDTLD